MLPTTHIAASCLLTACAVTSNTDRVPTLLVLTAGSLLLHFAMDLVPHGFITTPLTIFKKFLPTVAELLPGPLILFFSILMFGNPLLFLIACCCGLLPDLCTTLLWNNPQRYEKIRMVRVVHALHRRMHWFETDHPDGSVSHRFANRPLLLFEMVGTVCILVILFMHQAGS